MVRKFDRISIEFSIESFGRKFYRIFLAGLATSQQQRRLLLKQVGLEMTLEKAWSRIWCSKIGWQTVPIHVRGPLTAKLR